MLKIINVNIAIISFYIRLIIFLSFFFTKKLIIIQKS